MRPFLAISVVAVSLLACGPDAAAGAHEGWVDPAHWSSDAPTADQVKEKLGPPVTVRSEPPVEVWTYCGERKEDGSGFRFWLLEQIKSVHGTCIPQIEMTFAAGRLARIDQVDHPAIDYAAN